MKSGAFNLILGGGLEHETTPHLLYIFVLYISSTNKSDSYVELPGLTVCPGR